MTIYIVYTYSYAPGDILRAFTTLEQAKSFRDSISIPVENGDSIEYQLNTDSFYNVGIKSTELVA